MSIPTPEEAIYEFRGMVDDARRARRRAKKSRNPKAMEMAKKMTKEVEDMYGFNEKNHFGY